MQQRVWNRQEIVNKCFKQWEVCVTWYRHDVCDHDHVFRTIVVLTQLSVEHREPLFPVNQRDKNRASICTVQCVPL